MLPGVGVPLHAALGIHSKRILGLVVVDVEVVTVLPQTPLASALYHRDQVPVPKPEVVQRVEALLAQAALLKQTSTTKLSVPFQANGVKEV